MNPFQLIKGFMTNGMSPKGIVQNMTRNNPAFNNLIEMANKGDTKGIEEYARNVLKQRGLDFDKEMENMKKVLNIQ